MAEHDWNIVVSAVKRPRLVLVNRLEGLSLPRNSATINWPAWHDLVVDWAVKLQHKQSNPEDKFSCEEAPIIWNNINT